MALWITAASVTIQPLQKSTGGSIAPEPGDVAYVYSALFIVLHRMAVASFDYMMPPKHDEHMWSRDYLD